MTALNPAQVLRDAADLIAVNGLFVDNYWDPATVEWRPGMALDIVGAIGVARGLTRHFDVCQITGQGQQRTDPAIVAVLQHLDLDSVDQLGEWSDARAEAGEGGRAVAVLCAVAAELVAKEEAGRVLDFSYRRGGVA